LMTKTNIAYQIINHLRKGIVSGNAKREALMENACPTNLDSAADRSGMHLGRFMPEIF
jgi:hypothetical protein